MRQIFALLFFCNFVFAQNTNLNTVDTEGKKQGPWKNYSVVDGKEVLASEGNYSDNMKTGDWTFYHPNGNVKRREQYLMGMENGKFIAYFENGSVSEKGTLINNKYVGDYELYEAPGVLREKRYFNSEGRKEGKQAVYYDGKLSSEGIYKDGEKIAFKQYYSEGTLKIEYYKDSIDKRYHPNGKLNFENIKSGQYRIHKYYSEQGTLTNATSYFGNKREGNQILYYPNGNPKFACMYKDDKMVNYRLCFTEDGKPAHGVWKIYFPNGQLEREGKSVHGKADGLHKLYNSNGKLVLEVNYKNGKPDGETRYYDHRGQLYLTEVYKSGAFIKETRAGQQ